MNVKVSSAGKPSALTPAFPINVAILGDRPTIRDVKAAITNISPKLDASRQRITLPGDKKPLSDDTRLEDAGIVDGGELLVKDLGAQVSWRTVFLVEYLGPLVIHPLFYYLPGLFYGDGQPVQHSLLQKYVYTLVMLHFVKRELETLFIHRFSHDTMPIWNLFKNSAHYHFLSGLVLAYDVYRPAFSASSPYIHETIRDDPRFLWVCCSIWLFAELSNLHSHLILRSLRPAGTRKRAIPYGYGFSLVSCPNYFFESVAWLSICVMTGSYAALLFTAVGIGQMGAWAVKKHKAYRKEFGSGYPRGRKAMVPFVL